MSSNPFLAPGNGNQTANRRKELAYVRQVVEDLRRIYDSTVELPPFGRCRFSAYSHPDGAMISSPNRDDYDFGAAAWHGFEHMMLFRDSGDGRGMKYVCPVTPLFAKRTIGHHGVRWDYVLKLAVHKKVFRLE